MKSSRRRNHPRNNAKQPSAKKKSKQFSQLDNVRTIAKMIMGPTPSRSNAAQRADSRMLNDVIIKLIEIFTELANKNQYQFPQDNEKLITTLTRLISTHPHNIKIYNETNAYAENGPFESHQQLLRHLYHGSEADMLKLGNNAALLIEGFMQQPDGLQYYFRALKENNNTLATEMMSIFHASLKEIQWFNKRYDEKFPDEYLADYLAIAYFLNTQNLVTPYIDLLEYHLQKHANKNFNKEFPSNNTGLYTFPFNVRNIHDRHKVLSSVLYNWAKEQGFQSSSKILRAISHNQFHSLLRNLSFMKDVGIKDVGELHGAWSHAIQWFCIIEGNKEKPFLKHNPLDLYRFSSVVWNQMFDILNFKGFCCPDGITRILIEPESYERWPLLSETIARSQSKMISPHFNYEEMTRKKHGEVYEQEGFVIRPF